MRWFRRKLLELRVAALQKSIEIMEQRVQIAVTAGWTHEISRRRFEIADTQSRIASLRGELKSL